DFANQVRWSADYAAACKKANHAAGKVLNPLAGEFFSGLVRSKFHPKAMTVEKNPYCRQLLQARMDEGLLHFADIAEDVCTYDGVSTASTQGGLKDHRTKLVCHIFRVFDTLPPKQRRVMYFENVKALLGKKRSMRQLFNYLVQAGCTKQFLSLKFTLKLRRNLFFEMFHPGDCSPQDDLTLGNRVTLQCWPCCHLFD
ncbi:Uncharacterized protein SCF082_LOCUS9657, partial [Durusdinium trenchii]